MCLVWAGFNGKSRCSGSTNVCLLRFFFRPAKDGVFLAKCQFPPHLLKKYGCSGELGSVCFHLSFLVRIATTRCVNVQQTLPFCDVALSTSHKRCGKLCCHQLDTESLQASLLLERPGTERPSLLKDSLEASH